MQSVYLEPDDYEAYGVPVLTEASKIAAASQIINSFLQRPEGLIWVPDGNGNPCYMQALAPQNSVIVTSGAISAGQNVTVFVSGQINSLQTGSVLILDRENPEITEAVIIQSIPNEGTSPNGNNEIILQFVQFDHDADAALEFDLTLVEEQDMPNDRWELVLKRTPIANVINGQGQLGYSRRADSYKNNPANAYALLPPIARYGAPPIWQSFLVLSDSWDRNTGRIWISQSIYLTYYSQVRMYYVAGWTYQSLPAIIKMACANIVNANLDLPIFGNYKTIKQGDTMVTRWGDTIIDGDTKEMLKPFQARLWG